MFKTILVPVDLAHAETLEKALSVSADLARHYGAKIIYVGVTSTAPGKVAHTPEEFSRKLDAFATAQASARGIAAEGHAAVSHDPTVDVDDTLLKTAQTLAADLVVMASHVPGLADYIWPSNGGKMASHAKASVMVVRG